MKPLLQERVSGVRCACGTSIARLLELRPWCKQGGVTFMFVAIQPLVALIAGVLILLIPRLLNYIVAIYLIVVGILGLFPTR